jgi:hypothetical protein
LGLQPLQDRFGGMLVPGYIQSAGRHRQASAQSALARECIFQRSAQMIHDRRSHCSECHYDNHGSNHGFGGFSSDALDFLATARHIRAPPLPSPHERACFSVGVCVILHPHSTKKTVLSGLLRSTIVHGCVV